MFLKETEKRNWKRKYRELTKWAFFLYLSLSFFTQHRTSVSKNHRRTKYAFTNLNGIPKYADVRAYCSHVKMYCKRARLLSCHPRLFISLIISFEVPTKTKRKTKQCIANTIKTTIDLPLHLTERAPHSNKEGGSVLEGVPLSVQCSGTLLIFDFKVRRSFEGGALSIERNRILCFSKERLFIPHLNWGRRSFEYIRFW